MAFTPRFLKSLSLWMPAAFMAASLMQWPVAQAQNNAATYPQKPVKIMVGFSPGGVPDIVARVLAPRFTETWKQPAIVENRLGAGSNVAAALADLEVYAPRTPLRPRRGKPCPATRPAPAGRHCAD